jgi:Transglycosylase SLT domain
MRSTRKAAHRAAVRSTACAVVALALTLTLTTPAQAAHYRGGCANRLCTRDLPRTPSCWRLRHDSSIARCFIARAAARYGQPRSQAFYIAWRESRYHWRVTNRSSGAAGLFQFMPTTWAHSPYRHRSPYNPRWAALAAMWYWAHGGMYHWRA